MLKNRREYMKKDIELRMNNEMQAEESDKILKGLLTELDKLKGAVQSRIKTGSRKRLNYTKH